METKFVNDTSYFDSFGDFAACTVVGVVQYWYQCGTRSTGFGRLQEEDNMTDDRVKMTLKLIQIKGRKDSLHARI